MDWQYRSVSDISMSGEEDVAFEYSESEDDGRALSPKYATGTSMRTSREMSQSSRIVRFSSSNSLENEQQEAVPAPRKAPHRKHSKKQQPEIPEQPETPQSRHKRMWNAVSNLAHSVSRSPQPKRSPSRTKQYPHSSPPSTSALLPPSTEASPLLTTTAASETSSEAPRRPQKERIPTKARPLPPRRPLREERAIDIAASFLRDCERGRRPSLPADLTSITDTLLTLRRWKYSLGWQVLTHLACIALFVSSALESRNRQEAFGFNLFAILVFVMDMVMGSELRKSQFYASDDPVLVLRHSRMEVWTMPMILMFFCLGLEMVCTIGSSQPLWSGALKPIALFYLSNRAKNAMEALNRIFRIVLRVLVMELFLILCFATVACQLYSEYDSFHDLSTSWLSLFQCKSLYGCGILYIYTVVV